MKHQDKLEDAFVKKRMSPPLLRITVNGNRNGNGDKRTEYIKPDN
jgi:hypothetical protein